MSARPVSDLFREIIIRAIVECPSAAERKERILIAYQEGFFTLAESQALVTLYALEAA